MTQAQFIEKWHKLRKSKKSNILAGLDPAPFSMRRNESLPKNADILEWSFKYIDAVSPYVAGVKINAGYFNFKEGGIYLSAIVKKLHRLKLLAIIDSKIADIGSTAEAWVYNWKNLGFDALTIAPFAGNGVEIINMAHKYKIAAIAMGIMSNPEYKTEMNFKDENSTSLYIKRTKEALKAGAEAIVVGGTYTKDDKEFMEFIKLTKESEILYLVPGIGFQGGGLFNFLSSGIDYKRCMINIGRSLMYPKGSKSTEKDQETAAKFFKEEFNRLTKNHGQNKLGK